MGVAIAAKSPSFLNIFVLKRSTVSSVDHDVANKPCPVNMYDNAD